MMHSLFDKQWVVRVCQNRFALLVLLFAIQMQFFLINLLNARLRDPSSGWELKIGFIDNNLTPESLWMPPYWIGFFLAVIVPLWAMFHMPNKLYRQFLLAMMLAALFSYIIYIVFPTYVVKPAPEDVPGNHFLAHMLRKIYDVDAAISSHNAAPSQHVFYAVLNMCFMIRFRPRWHVLVVWVTLTVLIIASALFTMRHNSPDLIFGYLVAIGAYYLGLRLGENITARLGDGDGLFVMPIDLKTPAGWLRYYRRLRRRTAP